tara:strand:+ start:4308 stop:4574 length:267 start_codon:yes stop_codon:yes gene_type:complete
MKPLHDNVLVQPIIEKEKTQSGIFLTKEARKKNRAHVIKVGPKVKTISPGDTIMYYDNEGIEIQFRSDTLLMLNEGGENRRGNIICVL